MRRSLFLIITLLCICFFALTVAAEDAATEQGKPEWQTFVEETVVPYAIFGITCVGTVYLAVSPVLARMRRASDKYSTSADGVNTVSESSKKNTEEVKALKKEIAALREEMVQRATADHALLVKGVKMMALAFSHDSELVKNGTAGVIVSMAEEEQDVGEE
jgi:hypothetical protein